jgi:hypothetical protein
MEQGVCPLRGTQQANSEGGVMLYTFGPTQQISDWRMKCLLWAGLFVAAVLFLGSLSLVCGVH